MAFKKIECVEALTEHFANQGKRMTNLKKASLPELLKLVDQNNINMDVFVTKRKKEQKEARERAKAEQIENEIRYAKYDLDQLLKQDLYKKLKVDYTLVLDVFKNQWCALYQLRQNAYYETNKERIDKGNIQAEADALKLFKGVGINGVVDGTTINYNGIIVHVDTMNSWKKMTDDHIRDMYHEDNHLCYMHELKLI
tara:strand:+ start:150 stop:740 length:591 start_codon:yes stop_codon:yes gene_type:complete